VGALRSGKEWIRGREGKAREGKEELVPGGNRCGIGRAGERWKR